MNQQQFYKWFARRVFFEKGVLTGTFEDYASNAFIKFQIARAVGPKFIVEIGVKCGFSAASMLKGARLSKDKFLGIDNYDPSYYGWGVENAAVHRSRADQLFPGRILYSNSREMKFPKADFYHIDGDHTEQGVYSDICSAFAANSKAIVLLDDSSPNFKNPVCSAADRFCMEWGASMLYIPSWRGDTILSL